jgi:hypothetical protein
MSSAAVGGLFGGAVATGNLEGALTSALTAVAFSGVGSWAETFTHPAQKIAAHAVTGCFVGEATGGTCGTGALSAAAGKAVTIAPWGSGPEIKFVQAVTAGGVASVLGGGKFGNGAWTAGFGYLFNQLSRAQELMNERIKSGAACPPSHAHMCAGLKAGTPEELAKTAAMEKAAGLVADTASTGLAMAAAVPNPLSPELAGAAILRLY